MVAHGRPDLCTLTTLCTLITLGLALQDGAARVLRYLRDGSFLDDAQSASLDVRLLTYNPALDVLG